MDYLNPAHINAVIEYINSCPFFELLSFRVKEIGIGYSRCETILSERHNNPFGALHGGVYSSLIDSAATLAAYCSLPEENGMISIDLHVDNIATTKTGVLIAEGRLLKAGRTICFTEAVIKDETGRLLAHGTSKVLVTSGLQVIGDTVLASKGNALPPKYL